DPRDRHRPYFVLADGLKDEKKPASYFKTFAFPFDKDGEKAHLMWVVHVDHLHKGMELLLSTNTFDFEFLDSGERRFQVRYKDGFRKSLPYNFSNKPYLLEEIDEFAKWWKRLTGGEEWFKIKLTESQVKQWEYNWTNTLANWDVDIAKNKSAQFKLWEAFVRAGLVESVPFFRKTLHDKQEDLKCAAQRLEETVKAVTSGLLLDVFELYLHILKQRIDK
ncbi:MAG: hypothetical protein QMD09_14025, partial [Desulfatibacillaceae bacterium]|nr:hypothetical protein [Desulfatibacillaceae bacterium]